MDVPAAISGGHPGGTHPADGGLPGLPGAGAFTGYAAEAPYVPYVPAPAPYEPAAFTPVVGPPLDVDVTQSVLGPVSIAPTLHRGRAARRRQVERWKKNRRRAGVATAFALFGGGVTVAATQAGGAGKGGTAAASSYDTVAPVTLRTDGSLPATPVSSPRQSALGAGPHSAAAPQRHTGAGTSTRPVAPTAPATRPVTDDAGTAALPGGGPSSVPVAYGHSARPTATTAVPVASPSASASGGAASGGAPAATSSAAPADSAAPATSAPTASTAPGRPGHTHHGLCLLVLCVD
ncbi:hypothetical protein [Streptomyces sp. NBC_01190]|uniref:hypothetical protein n=1 Tax=Streptomyces sp. NBC_01190 TaxID=2903767 RepID=UPI00386653AE|nr:hypothetical protein OG519_18055 [Streptomyces sp. NBC_01190]